MIYIYIYIYIVSHIHVGDMSGRKHMHAYKPFHQDSYC